MKTCHLLSLGLGLPLALAQAQQNAYLTDFPPVSALAPCAASGFWWAANSLNGDCNTAAKPPAYASCACLKNQNSAFMASAISYQVTNNCGSTATDDVNSALSVFSAYCTAAQPAAAAATTTPTAATAPQITAIPGTSELAPCAAGAWYWAINSLASDCNINAAPTAQASCACLKDQNSAFVTKQLSIQITNSCGSTATDDITSAYALFSSYCGYAKAVSTAATATATTPTSKSIPDLTNIPALTSLAPCASTGFYWAANSFSSDCNANAGPTGVASCVCQKDQNANAFATDISTQVGYYCGSTAIEDTNSALSVFSGYCDLVGGIVGGAVLTVGYSYTAAGSGAAATSTGNGGYYSGKTHLWISQNPFRFWLWR